MHLSTKWFYILLVLVAAFLIYYYTVPWVRHIILHFETKELYSNLPNSRIPWEVYARSTQEKDIYFKQMGNGGDTTLIFGAFHGDEQTSFHLITRLADSIYSDPGIIQSSVILVPVVNPDGLMKRSRLNANDVDINRNFPTENWSPVYQKDENHPGRAPGSERETQVVMAMINEFKPDRIITIHDALHMNNYDGPAEDLAKEIAKYNGYKITTSVGYSTPGSFGTFTGVERKIPVVTLELPDISPDKAWQDNKEALIRAINFKSSDN